jgi:site-specific DNA recombinase
MKIAAYCRVSTDKEDQTNSFESQQRYFREYILRHPGWELYQVYADEGVTGTSTKKREAFNRMIQDARQHRFQLILTKEVSRFSRNILDTISYTRDLKALGIGVRFMNDGIDTLDPDAELRLSIMGSIAQEESRRTSARVKWGQTRRMEQGVVFGRSMLGYDVKNGAMTIQPEGAEIVRLIFHKYVHQRKGTTVIARELREAGFKTLTGSVNWRNTVILKILRNEKYCGDLKQKKTITPDYLTHRKQYNHGEEEFIFLKDHHPPIVSRELWEETQREIARRDMDGKCAAGHGSRYPLSGKIKCGECGRSFVSRTRLRKNGSRYKVWRCGTAAAEGSRHIDPAGNVAGCDVGCLLRDEMGLEMVRQAVTLLDLDAQALSRSIVQAALEAVSNPHNRSGTRLEDLTKELEQVIKKKKGVLDAFFAKHISAQDMKLMNAEYDRQATCLTQKIRAAEAQKELTNDPSTLESKIQKAVEAIVHGGTASEKLYGDLLDHITIYSDKRMEVRLKLLPGKWTFTLISQLDRKP